jgi:quercetin 2,3-dioxygenase
MTEVEIFPAAGRSVTHGQSAGVQERGGIGRPGIETRHSFAFGAHYDPKNTGFGLLVAHNDETLEPGAGFDMHPHRDAEIVTWVAEGTVRHIDSLGNDAQLGAGTVAWQGAGSGIVHSERNASAGQGQPARFIQVWLTPDEFGLEPGYTCAQVKLRPNELTLIAGGSQGQAGGAAAEGEDVTSGEDKGLPLRIRQRHAAFYAARLEPGGSINLVPAQYTHVFVVSGVIRIDGGGLEAGDAARIVGTGDGELRVQCLDDAEILIWHMEKSTRDLLS